MGNSKRLTRQDLEDGSLLKGAVHAFYQEQTKERFIDIMVLLRDSYVWIPCNAVLSEKDQAFLAKLADESSGDPADLVGREFSNLEDIRLVPDILQNGDEFFFPVFSSTEEMGEYGNHFSKVEKHMLEAIVLARNNEKNVAGIVLNAFTEPFRLNVELFDILENVKSVLEE